MGRTEHVTFTDADGSVFFPDSCTPLENAWKRGEIELITLARGSYPGKMLTDGNCAGVMSIGYWDAASPQGWGLPWHRNEGIEICLLESGQLTFASDDSEFRLKPLDITITRPWITHRLGNPHISPCKLHWLILDVDVRQPHQSWRWPDWIILNKYDLLELTTILRQNESPIWRGNDELKWCFDKIGKLIHAEEDYDSRLKILINTMLMLLLDIFRQGRVNLDERLTDSRRTVELFARELESRFADPWTLSTMAAYCKLGRTQFSNYFHEISNGSPMAYLNNIRLIAASKLLLENQNVPAASIGYDVGFSSNQYFTTVFKRQFRMTPQEYRRTMAGGV